MGKTCRRKYTEAKLDLIKTGQSSGWGAKKIVAKYPREKWSVSGVAKARRKIKQKRRKRGDGWSWVAGPPHVFVLEGIAPFEERRPRWQRRPKAQAQGQGLHRCVGEQCQNFD